MVQISVGSILKSYDQGLIQDFIMGEPKTKLEGTFAVRASSQDAKRLDGHFLCERGYLSLTGSAPGDGPMGQVIYRDVCNFGRACTSARVRGEIDYFSLGISCKMY